MQPHSTPASRTEPPTPPAVLEPLLVVGDAMLDRYWEGEVERISPEAPVPVIRISREHERAGGAANVALNLVALGHPVTLATLVGDDDAGERLAAMMAMNGVAWAAVRDPQMPTTQKIRPVCRRQQMLRIDFEGKPAESSVQRLMVLARPLFAQHRWALLSDYDKGCLCHSEALIADARRAGCKVLADPKGVAFDRYRGAYLLKPNEAELRAVVGAWSSEADFLARAHSLRAEVGVEHLLVTRGELGMTLCSADADCMTLPATVREVYDVSGAGDTVLATLAHALAEGRSMKQAVHTANLAAGIVVGKFGTASITGEELERALAESPAADADACAAAASARLARMHLSQSVPRAFTDIRP